MAASNIESELQAVKAITSQLTALDEEARKRVLDYVFKLLGLPTTLPTSSFRRELIRDIRSLQLEKEPRNTNEMAAVVAYYLSELAPAYERKETISTVDIRKYFMHAGFPLPKDLRSTLPNATAAGYFDSVAHGQYKLNPIGYNLVARNFPFRLIETPTKAKRNVANKKSKKNSSSTKKDARKKATR
jgi:hypothetical protein